MIWVFHRVDGYDLVAHPPSDDRPHGVFATRSPQRPNPIGLTVVQLLGRDGILITCSCSWHMTRESLLEAGIEQARGLVACTGNSSRSSSLSRRTLSYPSIRGSRCSGPPPPI